MEFLNKFRLGMCLLAAWGIPPYLYYSAHKLAAEQNIVFLSLFLTSALSMLFLFLWVLRLKGAEYIHAKSLWERPAAVLLILLSLPLLLFTSLLIRLESPGAPLYCQKRIGMNSRRRKSHGPSGKDIYRGMERRKCDLGGRPFTIFKLRSMRNNAEEKTGVAWSTGDSDPRVTKIGYYIRKTHLDELPQLLNVLLGHMSLIGPRPERPDFIVQLSKVVEGYHDRLQVPPGITGLSQVRKEHDESLEDVREKIRNDREYIENVCLLLDIKIVLKTIVLMTTLFWNAIRKRTIEKIEPKTPDIIFLETPRSQR